ncbi:MAG TPA: hypothetical protein PKW21_13705 [Rhabdaerophilum sp.]|nr:hypothetical protein [Rhabdaerophilum sp.]
MTTYRPALFLALAVSAQAVGGSASAADVKRFIEPCGSGKLCPWYQADIAAPASFRVDPDFSRGNRLLAFFPDRAKLGPDDPLIYIRTSQNDDNRSLDTQVSTSNARWKEMVKDSKVERLADIERADGKGKWQVFRYTNPSRPRQAHEMLAFGEHVETSGQKFFYMVTISAANEKAVSGALPAWRDILGKL